VHIAEALPHRFCRYSEHRLRVGGGGKHMSTALGGSGERNGRHGEDDLRCGVHQVKSIPKLGKILNHVLDCLIVEFVPGRIKGPALDAWTDREHSSVHFGAPAFRKSQCKHENVQRLKHAPHTGEVLFPFGNQLFR
jgi:hypothetical protein